MAELQATRSPEAAVRSALERVGEQVSGILQRAHDTAEEITAQSRAEAEDRLEHARIEAARDRRAAPSSGSRTWTPTPTGSGSSAHRIVEDARELAQQLTALADAAVERFPEAEAEHAGAAEAGLYEDDQEATVVAADDVEATTRMQTVEPPPDDSGDDVDSVDSVDNGDGADSVE